MIFISISSLIYTLLLFSADLHLFSNFPSSVVSLYLSMDNFPSLWRSVSFPFSFLAGCTYNHQHAAADSAAPASAVPGAADEAAATSHSFLLLFLLRWSASPWWPHRRPWLRQINPGPLHRPTPGSGPRRHTAHQRAAVFAQRLQHLPSLWV